MKKEVFRLFTIENGIMLSAPVLEYISNNFKDIDSIHALLKSFQARFNTASLSLDQVKELSMQPNNKSGKERAFNNLELKTFKYCSVDFYKCFQDLSLRLRVNAISLSLLQEGVEKVIFGIFSRSRNGKYLIEDDYDVIEVDLSDVQSDGFLFENMFVGLKGIKSGDFKVKELILPKYPVHIPSNNLELIKNAKICVFGCFDGEFEFVKTVLSIETPDFCIVSVKNSINGSAFEELCSNVIICPSRFDAEYIPFNLNNISNPFLINIFNNLIGFIDYNLFEHRKNGMVFNNNHIESFLKSILSQGSICPFAGSDFSVPYFPSIMIISQDFHPLVLDVEGIKFISLPPVKEKCYAVLDFNNDLFEVKCF
ncbi:uncharacterized protein VICG_00667 [Vittaforma corneae ATCC 50505]|uniref:DNA polymerase alpha/delta/epsilon subunit B domain-containing protein n=1 Tax=Vittaforma corneae (strain ATCC 50505) TaxID=993615 RepID=L2GMZ5_VITCO|nr:uncharacterized protein VICG_00667 [Vittaforma corneae ATCC 50505]ELA42268.1 hypothetical protein VICG_00667 [Vittaforma corneae ATCC 50505]